MMADDVAAVAHDGGAAAATQTERVRVEDVRHRPSSGVLTGVASSDVVAAASAPCSHTVDDATSSGAMQAGIGCRGGRWIDVTGYASFDVFDMILTPLMPLMPVCPERSNER